MFSSPAWPDLVNGLFELLGAVLTWRNYVQLRRDRTIAGVYWPTTAFFAGWGLWNLIYYPALGQWLSFAGGVALVAGNLAWVALAVSIRLDRVIKEAGCYVVSEMRFCPFCGSKLGHPAQGSNRRAD